MASEMARIWRPTKKKILPPLPPLIRGAASFYHMCLSALDLPGQAKEREVLKNEKKLADFNN